MDNYERSFFQERSDLRSDHLPLTALLHKCVGPDELSSEKILLFFLHFDDALADNDSGIAIKAHSQIVNLEFGENDIAGHALQIALLSHDPAVRPDNRAIVRLNAARV